MQKYLYLIALSFVFTSCYTYQRKKQVVATPTNVQVSNNQAVNSTVASDQFSDAASKAQINKSQQKLDEKEFAPINIQSALQPTKNYKIKADGKVYKIIVDKWEGDTLVAHPIGQSAKILKLHKSQINAESIAEKRFSKPLSDMITILVYAGIGVGLYMILR
jgi:hypothetical protein